MTDVRVVPRDRRDILGEGPLWSAQDGALYWVDILGQRLNRLVLSSDTVTSIEMPDVIGWVIERRDRPGFIAGLGSGFAAITLDPLAISPIADADSARPGKRMNDAKADRLGRIFAGTKPDDGEPAGGLYRLDPNHSVTLVDDDYRIPNGPAISPDGRAMFHTDSAAGCVYRLPIDETGALGERALFLLFPPDWGSPDGMTFDAAGGLWIAHWGGSRVSRFLPDGTLDRSIALPASQITSCTFGGPALDRMFITSAADGVDEPLGGALFEVDAGVCGLPAQRFAG